MPRDESLVSVQILIDPKLRRTLKMCLAKNDMTYGDLIIPHLEAFVEQQGGNPTELEN